MSRSDLIVLGTVQNLGAMLNMAREGRTQPDPRRFGVGQVYRMHVDHALKGAPNPELEIIRFEGYVMSTAQPDLAAIAQARACEQRSRPRAQDDGSLPLVGGVPYLLYLRGPLDYYHEYQGWLYGINALEEHPSAATLQQVEQRIAAASTPVPTSGTALPPTPTAVLPTDRPCSRLADALYRFLQAPDRAAFVAQQPPESRLGYDGQRVEVGVWLGAPEGSLAHDYGLQVTARLDDNTMRALVPVERLCTLADDPRVRYVGVVPPTAPGGR